MGFAKEKKKKKNHETFRTFQNKISLHFLFSLFLLYIYIYSLSKKIERKKQRLLTFTPNPLQFSKKKISKITSFENVADSFPKYKKKKKSLP